MFSPIPANSGMNHSFAGYAQGVSEKNKERYALLAAEVFSATTPASPAAPKTTGYVAGAYQGLWKACEYLFDSPTEEPAKKSTDESSQMIRDTSAKLSRALQSQLIMLTTLKKEPNSLSVRRQFLEKQKEILGYEKQISGGSDAIDRLLADADKQMQQIDLLELLTDTLAQEGQTLREILEKMNQQGVKLTADEVQILFTGLQQWQTKWQTALAAKESLTAYVTQLGANFLTDHPNIVKVAMQTAGAVVGYAVGGVQGATAGAQTASLGAAIALPNSTPTPVDNILPVVTPAMRWLSGDTRFKMLSSVTDVLIGLLTRNPRTIRHIVDNWKAFIAKAKEKPLQAPALAVKEILVLPFQNMKMLFPAIKGRRIVEIAARIALTALPVVMIACLPAGWAVLGVILSLAIMYVAHAHLQEEAKYHGPAVFANAEFCNFLAGQLSQKGNDFQALLNAAAKEMRMSEEQKQNLEAIYKSAPEVLQLLNIREAELQAAKKKAEAAAPISSSGAATVASDSNEALELLMTSLY